MGDDISTDGIQLKYYHYAPIFRNKQILTMLLIQLSMIEPSKTKEHEGYCVIAGDNFAQGSSREHA
jgi:aconitate hydratase